MDYTSGFESDVCRPFFHKGSEDGILLMHGFTGSAAHMRKLADGLAAKGYMEQWDFDHWGITYWSKTPELLRYAAEHGWL